MRDFAQIKGDGIITPAVLKDGLAQLEIDSFGLERQDRNILRSIIENYGGGPVGAETLAISVGEGIDSLEDFYEPYLIQRGLIQSTPRGRVATAMAYQHLGLPQENKENKTVKTKDFSFDLPEDLVAQTPPEIRGSSRIMVMNPSEKKGFTTAQVTSLANT
jgi:Holliday junction DNA helicase RuvB